jgi:hypothetical protein
MVGKEQFYLFGNGRQNNKKFTLGAGDTVTCWFKASGVDTATDKYYDLRSEAKQVSIILNKAAALTHIDGKELDAPITLPTGGYSRRVGIDWGKITVHSDQAATTFEIYAN